MSGDDDRDWDPVGDDGSGDAADSDLADDADASSGSEDADPGADDAPGADAGADDEAAADAPTGGAGAPADGPAESSSGKGADEKFCVECGAVIKKKAEICPECGVRQPNATGGSAGGGGGGGGTGAGVGANADKDRVAAALLAILLGGLGAHKFYLGDVGLGLLYLCFSWTFIPAIIGLVEGIIYLTKSDEEFQRQYVAG